MRSANKEPPPLIFPLETRVLGQFRMVFGAVRQHFYQIEKQAGIGGAQVWALSVIRCFPGISIKALSEHIYISHSTASNLVRALARKGLVETIKSTDDRRCVCVTVTQLGRETLERVPPPHEGVLPHALKKLPQSTLESLEAGLESLLAEIQPDESSAQIPLAEL